MNDPKNPRQRKVKLHVPNDLSAVYSNSVILSMTKNEAVLDFAQIIPTDPRANVQSRVIMTPSHAKLLYKILERNLERYEAKHGEIELDTPPSLAEQLFQGIQGDEDDDE